MTNINIDTIGNVFLNHRKIANASQKIDGTKVIDFAGNLIEMPKTRYRLSDVSETQEFYDDLLIAISTH